MSEFAFKSLKTSREIVKVSNGEIKIIDDATNEELKEITKNLTSLVLELLNKKEPEVLSKKGLA